MRRVKWLQTDHTKVRLRFPDSFLGVSDSCFCFFRMIIFTRRHSYIAVQKQGASAYMRWVPPRYERPHKWARFGMKTNVSSKIPHETNKTAETAQTYLQTASARRPIWPSRTRFKSSIDWNIRGLICICFAFEYLWFRVCFVFLFCVLNWKHLIKWKS